jgi:hypothetical protein
MVTLLTLDMILDEVKARGLAIEVINGVPRLRGPRSEMTSTLLDVLKARREEVIARLAPSEPKASALVVREADGEALRPREWLWPDGMLYVADMTSWLGRDPTYHPRHAGWWRWLGEGEDAWRELPCGVGRQRYPEEHRRLETWARMEDV